MTTWHFHRWENIRLVAFARRSTEQQCTRCGKTRYKRNGVTR